MSGVTLAANRASICFALRFKQRPQPNLAFGWNLSGAVLGGLIELMAMTVGLRALTLIALVAYLAAFLLYYREEVREASPAVALRGDMS